VDSVSQCADHGELAHALSTHNITIERVHELGRVIAGDAPARVHADQITIADLTGVAVQDIAIATHVCDRI
jgi:ornithine cyclodeaminase